MLADSIPLDSPAATGTRNVDAGVLEPDPCRRLGGKLPDEGKRPRPRHSLLKQGLHPHPGALQEAPAADDGYASLDPDTFLFLGADPAEYGLSVRNGQGPPNGVVAGSGSPVDDSDLSEDEIIEDDGHGRPPLIHGTMTNDDKELGGDVLQRVHWLL